MAKAIRAESLILKFTIMRELLLKILRFVAGAVSKKKAETEPVLGNVLFYINSQDSLISCTANDQEIQLQKTIKLDKNEIEKTGSFTVPFRKLYDVIRNLPDLSSIDFICTENKISLVSARTKLNLSSLPPNDFDTFKAFVGETNFTVKVGELKRAIDQTTFAMADNDVRYYLNGMLFDIVDRELRTVAADGHRLAVNSVEVLTGGNNNHMQPYLRFLVPRKAVTEIQRILGETASDGVAELAFRKNYICVSVNDGTFISKLLDSKFPEYQQLLEHNDKQAAGVLISDTQALKKACIRASVLFQDKSKGVQLKLNKNQNLLKILAVNSYNDFVEDEIEVDYQGDNLEIGFNVKYLIDLLSVISAKVVKFIFSGSGASVFVTGIGDGEGTYVLMPMKF